MNKLLINMIAVIFFKLILVRLILHDKKALSYLFDYFDVFDLSYFFMNDYRLW